MKEGLSCVKEAGMQLEFFSSYGSNKKWTSIKRLLVFQKIGCGGRSIGNLIFLSHCIWDASLKTE